MGLKEQFDSEGYIILKGILTNHKEIIESLRHLLSLSSEFTDNSHWNSTGFVMSPTNPTQVQKVQSLGLFAPHILDMVFRHSAIQSALAEIRPICNQDFFGTKFFPMYPGATSVNWHQDNHFFGTSSSHITSCAVYLEPTNQANGCLKVIPRSHLSGILPHAPGSGIWANGEWATGVNEEEAVQVECEAGSVVLFNSLLLHAANVNETTDRTRFSLFSHFVPRGLDFSWREEDFSYGVFKDRYHYVE